MTDPDPGASAPPPPAPRSAEERKQVLAQTLQTEIAAGARIESQSEFQAVTVRGHRTNHLLHFFVGVFTLGLWWLVWIAMAICGGEKRRVVAVDEFGNVSVQRV